MKRELKMRFTILTVFLLGVVVTASTCSAQTRAVPQVVILQPDGKPAAGARFYQNRQLGPQAMDMMGYDGGGGMSMGDDMGYGGAGGGFEMGMGSSSPTQLEQVPEDQISFLGGKPVQEISNVQGSEYESNREGLVNLNDPSSVVGRKRRHRFSSLAIHESGIHFIPAGTTFQKSVQLRKGGQIIVPSPKGIDPSQYVVLTCWQNGFAWPSLDSFDPSISYQFSNADTASDWRFKARFRLFHLGRLGEPITVPPGEIRVTILPAKPAKQGYESMNGETLFDQLISGGPSRLAVVSAQSDEPTRIEFGPLVRLDVAIANSANAVLPQWGDAPELHYHLFAYESLQSTEPQPGRVPSLPRTFSSSVAFANFLNAKRSERNAYRQVRGATTLLPKQLSFPMLRPGRYVLGLDNSNETATLWIPLTLMSRSENTVRMQAGESETATDLTRFVVHLNLTPPQSTENQTGTAGGPLSHSDVAKLKLVEGMRRELEQTMRRLIDHRRRLINIETALRAKQVPASAANPNMDIFGGPTESALNNPFPESRPSSDPFGGPGLNNPFDAPAQQDPFGSPGISSMNDPFSDSPGGPDPFGGNHEPFGPSQSPPVDQPFPPGEVSKPDGQPADPVAADPFG